MYKVFLADDEMWITLGLKKMILESGLPFQVIGEASNGVTALEEVEKKTPDVLITDIRMPGFDGLEMLEHIRKKKINTKVVIISGYAEFEYAQKAIRLHAYDYLIKPVEVEKLCSMLEGLKRVLDSECQGTREISEEPEVSPTMIQQIIGEIKDSYAEDITLTGLSEKYGVSISHLSSRLKSELGLSFSEYIMTKRIQNAKELLGDEMLSLDQIAEQVGYHDYFYFIKVFKKVTGISPAKYRKSL